MGYFPVNPPPGMSKENQDKWYKDQSKYYNGIAIGMTICGVLFIVLMALLFIGKLK